jgi:hypothetical protein
MKPTICIVTVNEFRLSMDLKDDASQVYTPWPRRANERR